MKSTASLAAFLLIATAAHAQAGYEQLSPAARKAYDACTDAAASKPTTEGVRIAMSTCNRRFLPDDQAQAPETTEAFAITLAEGLNKSAKDNPLPEDVLRIFARAIGKQVLVQYDVRSESWGPDSLAQRQKFERLTKDACETLSEIPVFTTGGLSVTYFYDDEKGNRLHTLVISQKQCDVLRYR